MTDMAIDVSLDDIIAEVSSSSSLLAHTPRATVLSPRPRAFTREGSSL